MKETIDKVNHIFIELFELEEKQLTPEANLYEGLGLDSLDTIDLIVEFQKEFNINPPNDQLKEIRTLNDVYQLVEANVNKAQNS